MVALLVGGGTALVLDQRCRWSAEEPACALVELTDLRERMIAAGALGDLDRIAVPGSAAHRHDQQVLGELTGLRITEPPRLRVSEIRAADPPGAASPTESTLPDDAVALCARSRTGSFRIAEGERIVEVPPREERLLFLLRPHAGARPAWRVAEVRPC